MSLKVYCFNICTYFPFPPFLPILFFPAESGLDLDSLIKELVKLPCYIVKDGKLLRVEGSTPFPCLLHFFFFSLYVTNWGKGRTQTQVLVPLKQPKMSILLFQVHKELNLVCSRTSQD